MFGWLKRWRQNRRMKNRAILKFWDGSRWRYGDPFAIFRALSNDPELSWERDWPDIDLGHEPVTSNALRLICTAFGVERWDEQAGRGLTDWEILALPTLLFDFFEVQKKSTSPGLTSSPLSAGESLSAEERQNQIGSSFAGCGSTSSGSGSASPAMSGEESAPG